MACFGREILSARIITLTVENNFVRFLNFIQHLTHKEKKIIEIIQCFKIIILLNLRPNIQGRENFYSPNDMLALSDFTFDVGFGSKNSKSNYSQITEFWNTAR